MRACLVNPTAIAGETMNVNVKNTRLTPHLGLMYLEACLRKEGHNVEIIDAGAKNLNVEETVREISQMNPDFVGITSTTVSYRLAKGTIKAIRALMPDVLIGMGGYHPTILPEFVMKDSEPDFVIVGEGEETLSELFDKLESKKSFENVKGIYYREGDKIKQTAPRGFNKNLDELPFPCWDSIRDLQLYGHLGDLVTFSRGEKLGVVITSRGCPHSCTFCAASKLYNHTYRVRRIENVVEEIRTHVENGRRNIYIQDDNFTASSKRVFEFCKKLKEESLDINWACLGRVDASPSIYLEMAKAGCEIMYFGIESGSQKVLEYYNKRFIPAQAIDAIRKANEANLLTISGFIVGAPCESYLDLEATLKLAVESGLDILEPNILTLFHGTKLWNDFNEKTPLPLDRPTTIEELTSVQTDRVRYLFNGFYKRKKHWLKVLKKVSVKHPRIIVENLRNIKPALGYVKRGGTDLCEGYPKRSDY